MLRWADPYDPISVQLSDLAHLQELKTFGIVWYGYPDYPYNCGPLLLLQRFRNIPILELFLTYPINMVKSQCLTEVITSLPAIENLHLGLSPNGHAFGPCVFHLLSISSCIRKLKLKICGDIKARTACSPGCVCHQQEDWETEEPFLNSLQEVEMCQLRGEEHEFAFLKQLLRWTAVLKTITVIFDPLISVSEEICQELLGLSSPETCMKIYLYRDGAKVMYAPVG